jgi:MFS family permease
MLIESWINEQSPSEKRGQVLSIYRMVDLIAVTIGQFLLNAADPKEYILFSVVAILISLAIFPISLSTSNAPMAVTSTKLNIKKLIKISPLAVAGCFAVGLSSGAFWAVAPVFVQKLGYPVLMVSIFMSVVVFSGAIMQWPIGWLSDKIGRRIVIIFVSVGGAVSGLFLWQFSPDSISLMILGGALYGMFAMQIFGMSAAHANDYAMSDEFVSVNGGLLLIYGIGSVIGPSVAPVVMTFAGPSAMFAYTALIQFLLALYGIYRLTQRDAPKESNDYVAMPRPRAALLILRSDPRNLLRRKKRNKA